MKIFIDICNAAKIMLLGNRPSLAIAWAWFHSKVECPSRVSGRALASTTLQAKPAWAGGKAKQVTQCI